MFKMNFLALLLLFLIFSCASKKEISQNEQTAQMYFAQGTTELIERRYTEALTNLIKANELNPKDDNIIVNLAMSYYFKNQKKHAVQLLQKAIQINPKNTDAKVNLATIALNEGKIQAAQKLYQSILTDLTYTKHARTYYNLGIIDLKNNDLVNAQKNFELSVKETSNYCPSHFELGKIYYSQSDFNQALQHFKKASLGSCYENPAPLYYQSLVYIKMNKLDDARMKLSEISSRFPSKNEYSILAREKEIEIREIKLQSPPTEHATNKGRTPAF